MAVRTRTLMRLRSPLLMPPKTDMTRSWASLSGSSGPPTLGDPELDSIVDEQREGEAELVAVERALGFADHDGVESTVLPRQGLEEGTGSRAALPGVGPGLADVEQFGDDLAAVRLDEGLGAVELPGPRRRGVLLVLGGHATVEGEQHDSLPRD
jgi:hypothetical protein